MTGDAGSRATRRARRPSVRTRRLRAGAVLAVALVIGFGLWLAFRGGGSSATSPIPKGSTAVRISVEGLRTISTAVGIPIYWAGERPGFAYELSKTADNRVFIRYLPSGTSVGTTKQYLTIGTYPVGDAFSVTSRLARRSGSVRVGVGKGGVAFYKSKTPTSVFLAYPGSDYQIEVYDPSPGRARELVTSGQVVAVS